MTTQPSELADDPDRQHVEIPDDDTLPEGIEPYPEQDTPQDFPDEGE